MYFCRKYKTLNLTIIGNSSASPRPDRHPSCQALEHNQSVFLIDCGEGSQFQLIRYHQKLRNIDHILISHLHGDHFYGIIGLISTFYLNKRIKPLHIYSNEKLKSIIDIQLEITETILSFPIIYHDLVPAKSEVIFESETLLIMAFPLNHRIPTHGFYFEEKSLMNKASANKSFAYCSDTLFDPTIAEYFQNVSLLYHEATFGDEKVESAALKFHSTASQAAKIAKLVNAKQLIIGHFSAKYNEPNILLDQAKCIFNNTEIATEGKSYAI
jgi:ribonuclease Z